MLRALTQGRFLYPVFMHKQPAPRILPISKLRRLGDFFLDCGYTEDGLRQVLSDPFPHGTPPAKVALLLDTDDPPSPLTTIVRLFTLARPVSRQQVRDILPEWVVDDCRNAGLLTEDENSFRSFFRVDPVGWTLLVSDSPAAGPVGRDIVSGNNPFAARLLNLTPRRPVENALDAFCGGGVQALHLAKHCERVSATELNPRAIRFAELNAGLNGIEKIRWLRGDRLAPVAGRQFDLIVANPPFFIGPNLAHLYSDNEMQLDAFCRDVVKQCATHLKPGGRLFCLAEWVELEGEAWRDRLCGWFEGAGCDAWVLTTYRCLPDRYAQLRLLEAIDPDEPASQTALKERVDYLRAAGVTGIFGGAIFLRRRQGNNWIEFDDHPVEITGPCGEEILNGFVRRDFLSRHPSDEQLLQSRLVVSEAVRLEEIQRLEENARPPEVQRLRVGNGMKYRAKVNDAIVGLLRRCDGSRTLNEVLGSGGETQLFPDDNQARLLDTVRRLIRRGVLEPEPASPQGRTI